MEFQNILNLVGSCALAFIGWWCRQIWESIQKLKDDVKSIEIDLPKSYVAKEDYKDDIDDIKVMLNDIYKELRTKADKS